MELIPLRTESGVLRPETSVAGLPYIPGSLAPTQNNKRRHWLLSALKSPVTILLPHFRHTQGLWRPLAPGLVGGQLASSLHLPSQDLEE